MYLLLTGPVTRICDTYEQACFRNFMADQANRANCNCLDDCELLMFTVVPLKANIVEDVERTCSINSVGRDTILEE